MSASEIWSWLQLNWGNVLSLIGTALTIFYAYGAKSAAEAAEAAARSAQARMQAVDWVLHISAIIKVIDDLDGMINAAPDWNLVSRECSKLRSDTATFNSLGSKIVEGDLRDRVKLSATKFAQLAKQADQYAAKGTSETRLSDFRRIFSEQREVYSIALGFAKKMASTEGRND